MTSGENIIDTDKIYQGVTFTLCGLALVLNVIVVVVVKFGKITSSVDIFIVNLSVSNIVQAAVITPIHFWKASRGQKDFLGDNAFCKIIMFIPIFIIVGAIYTMVAMAIDRYRIIIQQKSPLKLKSLWVVLAIWVFSMIVSAPQLYEYNLYDRVDDQNRTFVSCGSKGISDDFKTIYASVVFAVSYVGPLAILAICYIRISIFVWKKSGKFKPKITDINPNQLSFDSIAEQQTTRSRTERGTGYGNEHLRRRVKVLQMLMAITLTFAILWAPYFVVFAMTEVSGRDDTAEFSSWLHVLGRLLTVISTLTNPILYMVFSPQFRAALAHTPCKWPFIDAENLTEDNS